MRKLIVFCHISLDGIAAIESGALDWISYDEHLEKWAEPIVAETDTAVYGKATYEIMKYWQTVQANPEASEHELRHARWIENVEKIVVSTTLPEQDWNNTKVVKENIKEEILQLKQKEGKNITVFGSPTLSNSLIQMGLVDEFRLSINPIVLGTGKYLFKDLKESVKLVLVEEKTLASGVVTVRYEVK